MKAITSQLAALLATKQVQYASLYQFNLLNAGSLYYTSGDTNILWGGNVYLAAPNNAPVFDLTTGSTKARLTQKIGTAVDTFVLECSTTTATVNGQPFFQAMRAGVFDGADVIYSGAYWGTGTQRNQNQQIVPVGVITKMVGRVAECDIGRSMGIFNINSHLELLITQMPRNLYQAGCCNTLYDAGCKVSRTIYTAYSYVTAGSTNYSINGNAFGQPTGFFNQGYITFTSGVNNGVSRSIKNYTIGGNFTLLSPFPSTPANGDTFTAYAGCDKSQGTCQSKFNNLANFRGFPYVPVSETAI